MTSNKRQTANGGWISSANVSDRLQYRALDDWAPEALNTDYIDYFEDYRTRYFFDHMVPGQGLEEILTVLHTLSGRPERWIDLGAGVVSLFWSLALDTSSLKVIDVCDLMPEALVVLRRFVSADEIPKCYKEALTYLGREESVVKHNRTLPWAYHTFDCLVSWSGAGGLSDAYNLVTAIGCFGLASSEERYALAFEAAATNLRSGGRMIGVDWVRSPKFVNEEGHDNSYLKPALILDCAAHCGLSPLYLEKVEISDDPYYARLIVWAVESD